MSYEIVYTSSTSGLMPGTKGFCTVAATKGIASNTLKVLESLSGYRNTHTPTGGPHPKNPKVYSHLMLPTGESILSRIVDAGLDYSGRTNKLAHHLVMLRSDQSVPGPARVLSCPGGMVEAWEGDSRYLPTRAVPTQAEMTGPCTAWQRITGDAGWGGALANTAHQGSSREAYILFEEGMDCLALIDEALSLLPPKDRWQVTFSTFLTSLPVNMKCQWRCVLKGSKEHAAIPPHNSIFKIDLTSSLGTAPDSPLAQAARSGARPLQAVKPTPLPSPAIEKSSTADASDSSAFRKSKEWERRLPIPKPSNTEMAFPDAGHDASVEFQENAAWAPGLPPMENRQNHPTFKFKRKSNAIPLVLTALVAGLVGLLLGAGGFFAISQLAAGLNALTPPPAPLDEGKKTQEKDNKNSSSEKKNSGDEPEENTAKTDNGASNKVAQADQPKKQEGDAEHPKIQSTIQAPSPDQPSGESTTESASNGEPSASVAPKSAQPKPPVNPAQDTSKNGPSSKPENPVLPTIALFFSESTSPSIQGEKWDEDSVSLVENLTGTTDKALQTLVFESNAYWFENAKAFGARTELLKIRGGILKEKETGFQTHLKKWLVLKQDKEVKGIYRFGQEGWAELIQLKARSTEVKTLQFPDIKSEPMLMPLVDGNWKEISRSTNQPAASSPAASSPAESSPAESSSAESSSAESSPRKSQQSPSPEQVDPSKTQPDSQQSTKRKSWYVESKGEPTDNSGGMFYVIRRQLELELKDNTIQLSLSYPSQRTEPKAEADKFKSDTEVTKSPLAIKLVWPNVKLAWDENREVNLETTIKVQF